ncbi:MAG: hypothetical protein KA004_03885 [Verrucomicrobiales bacterium]|nr:hypothetical protein [Verrucomicrobiales bacterium]
MKHLITAITALAFISSAPLFAKEEKADKPDRKERKEKKEKEKEEKEKKKEEGRKGEKKETLYEAIIVLVSGEPTEADAEEAKNCLSTTTEFKTKEAKLEDKKIHVTLAVDTGRLSKSAVSRALKSAPKFKVEKLDDVKPDKEKKEDKDKDKEKKEEGKEEPKKEEPKNEK